LNAVKAGDVEQVAAMVTDDTVVVHGNGRCVRGRDEFRMDFLEGFKRFTIEQTVSSIEVYTPQARLRIPISPLHKLRPQDWLASAEVIENWCTMLRQLSVRYRAGGVDGTARRRTVHCAASGFKHEAHSEYEREVALQLSGSACHFAASWCAAHCRYAAKGYEDYHWT